LQQLEEDTGLSVGAAWIAGQDRSMWRTLRPSAGQAQQWVSEWVWSRAVHQSGYRSVFEPTLKISATIVGHWTTNLDSALYKQAIISSDYRYDKNYTVGQNIASFLFLQ